MSHRPVLWLALVLWTIGLARDSFDAWVEATVLPDLTAELSTVVLDREGRLLRAYTVSDGIWRLPVALDGVDPAFVDMLVAYEDKRFWTHSGVDPWAALRAGGQALWHGEIVSGGSTLTMQVARLLEDSGTGGWQGKLRQVRVALALERQLTKEQILTLYLLHAPYGGNIEGLRAASLTWFGREPGRLTPAQAALLVALPQSPTSRRPDRHPDAAGSARAQVLTRLQDAGLFDAETVATALTEPLPAGRRTFPALAPHLADRAVANRPDSQEHRLTIDWTLQTAIERLARDALVTEEPQMNIAILIADHTTGEILASVGSASYEADARQGFIDLTQAVRSPGSTLKPLVYALAFDLGLAHPETLVDDSPVDFGGYTPENFDGDYRGELRVRRALQMSLNIPVVTLTDAMGPDHLLAAMGRAGADPQVPGARPGLAVALGGLGVTLEDLVTLYAGLANGGKRRDLGFVRDEIEYQPRRITDPIAAWYVTDILLDTPRPRAVQGDGIAFKTGTSYGHRDAWAIGYDGRYVVGVWMGRADGTPVPGAFGGDLAAPVLFAAFERLGQSPTAFGPAPAGALLVGNADLPEPLRRFVSDRTIAQDEDGPEIAFPPDGAVMETGDVVVRVNEGRGPFTWLANGRPIMVTRERQAVIDGLGLGFTILSVVDQEGRSAATQIELR